MTDVQLENITHRYPGVTSPSIENVSLQIARGDLVCLLGSSGCGKTTTLKLIAGLLSPETGRVLFDGQDVTAVKAERREAVMVFQQHLLFPFMNVESNVAFGLRIRKKDRTEIRREVSRMLGLVRLTGLETRRPAELSGGQKQRVALARALVIRPKVLLLDEPLSNLDAALRDEMRELILTIKRELDITVIFVTHDQEEAVLLADCIALMQDGRILQYDRSRNLYERPASRQIARFFGNRNELTGKLERDRVLTPVGPVRIAPEILDAVHTMPGTVGRYGPSGMSLQPGQSDESGRFGNAGGQTGDPGVGRDRTVTLTARPEAITLVGAQDLPGPDRPTRMNYLPGRIERVIYMGRYTRYKLRLGDSIWEVIADPARGRVDDSGEVFLCLPPDRVWIFPA